jgi:hypothetical protein
MILESTFNVLLLAGFASAFVAIRQLIDPRLGGVLSLGIWALLTANAFDVVTEAQSANIAMESTAIFCGGMATVMLIFSFGAVAGQLPSVERTGREVMSR